MCSAVTPGPGGLRSAAASAAMIRDPLRIYVWLNARYGDAVRCPISPRHNIFLFSRPEHAEHVLAVSQDNYVKAFTYRPLRALIGDGLLTSEGDQWRLHRRLLQPMFSRRDVAGSGPAMTAAIARRLTAWDGLSDGTVLNVATQMSALTLDIVGTAVIGADLAQAAAEMSRAMNAGQRVAVLANMLPLSWGPRSTKMVRATARVAGRTPAGIDGVTAQLIAERRVQLGHAGDRTAPGHEGGTQGDLLNRLLTATTEDGEPLTDDEIAAEVATFMLAGHETTSNLLCWALALLSAYPAAREELEHEADTVLAGRPADADDVSKLPWASAVAREALRLYPPAWTIEREALARDTVAGTPVPAGDTVAVSPYLIHRNPEFWPDPAGFDPRRFLTSPPQRAGPENRYAYIPFGGGRRACIGQAFAEQEAVLALASIAQRYRLELPPGGMPRPVAGVTLRPGRLPMRLLRRTRVSWSGA